MHCTQCGQAAAPGDKFCAKCGRPLSSRASSKPQQLAPVSKTFKVPIKGLRSQPLITAQEATTWLGSWDNIRHVRLNLSISYGAAHLVTLNCERQNQIDRYRYGLDVIPLMPAGLRNMIQWAKNPTPDAHLAQWTADHPDAQILTERIVSGDGTPTQLWILYRRSLPS